MATAREYLKILNGQIERARLAIDERRSLLRVMEQQGEDTEDGQQLLFHLQHTLNEMIRLRDAALLEIDDQADDKT